jgi:flagellar protein FliT
MMDSHEIIAIYQHVAVITDQMLAAARSSDWDQLVELESRCADHIAVLTSAEARADLPGQARAQKVSIIKQILADDRAIRDLTMPWMAHLSSMISSNCNERKLVQAYGARHGA